MAWEMRPPPAAKRTQKGLWPASVSIDLSGDGQGCKRRRSARRPELVVTSVTLIRDLVGGWVNEKAKADPLEAARHMAFMLVRLGQSVIAFAIIPIYMVARGSLAPWEAMMVVCASAPLATVAALSRTGDFNLAVAISAAGHVAACLVFAFGAGGLAAPTLVWLALAPVDALLSLSVRVAAVVTGAVFATLAFLVALSQLGLIDSGSSIPPALQLLLVAPAFAYAALQTILSVQLNAHRSRIERIAAARYHSLGSAMGDLALRADRAGVVVHVDSESEGLSNLPSRELLGRGFFERLMMQDRPLFLKTLGDACAGGATHTCDLRLRTGSTPSPRGAFEEPVFTWIELRARLIEFGGVEPSEDGVLATMVVRDISLEKRREQELEAARLDAERSSAWKDRFLANMSHELRTPLNAIIGFSEILGNDDLMSIDDEKRREYAGIIHDSGKHLLDVVNSVLDISKMEAGRFSISPEPFDVAPLIDSCCDIVSLKAEQAGVDIKREIASDLPELTADKRACRQVMINLLGNALKFTPSGGVVRVGARREGDRVALFVSDTGSGMSACDLPRLGDAFFQAGAPDARTYEGTGLGLSVVRGLVGLHGGDISVESGVGLGTCVIVRLPVDCGVVRGARGSARIVVIPRGSAAPPAFVDHNAGSREIARKSA